MSAVAGNRPFHNRSRRVLEREAAFVVHRISSGGKVERRLGCVILVLCAVLSGFAPRSLPVERTSGAQERAPASVIGVAVLPVHATGEPAAGKEEKANTHLVLATNDMGPDLVQRLSIGTPPIDPQAILFLINAVYFRGDWQDPFDESATRPALYAFGRHARHRADDEPLRFLPVRR